MLTMFEHLQRIWERMRFFERNKDQLQEPRYNYVLDNDENAIIYLSLQPDDLLHPYSTPGYDVLNYEIYDFIDTQAYPIPVQYPLIIRIQDRGISQERKTLVERLIQSHYAFGLDDKRDDLRWNRLKIGRAHV